MSSITSSFNEVKSSFQFDFKAGKQNVHFLAKKSGVTFDVNVGDELLICEPVKLQFFKKMLNTNGSYFQLEVTVLKQKDEEDEENVKTYIKIDKISLSRWAYSSLRCYGQLYASEDEYREAIKKNVSDEFKEIYTKGVMNSVTQEVHTSI